MPLFSRNEARTLDLIVQTFVPDLMGEAGSASVTEALIRALERVTNETDRIGLKLFLNAVETGLTNRLAVGIGKPFRAMSREEREQLLRAWAQSQVGAARQIFQSLKRLTLFLAYSVMPQDQPNPAWAAIPYSIPQHEREQTERPIQPLNIRQPTSLTCDVVVVGSGAGGGVVAGELSAAGYDVIVVEKGGYYAEGDFHGHELESTERLYEKYGALTTDDKSMVVLAGSVLGGGTTVNWAASFCTPDDVREEWARDYGFSGATSAEFTRSLDAVSQRLNVNSDTPASPQNSTFAAGCQKLGYDVDIIARNVKGCVECGFCNFGCAYGSKQSTLKTYLQDAHDCGARFIVSGYTQRVWIERGIAKGVLVTITDETGQSHEVTIRAKRVVVAAGAIHTPALLLRSALTNSNIGANLHLHPTTVIYGMFDQPIRGWEGAPMTRISRQFADLDGRGYGVRLETAPVHPGIAALSLPWESGMQHQRTMSRLANLGNIIIITRDRSSGRVTLNRQGHPVLRYRLDRGDAWHMMRGVLEALKVHHAAGAEELCSPHAKPLIWRRESDLASFETYLQTVEAAGLKPNSFSLYSAHQMSSARIGSNTALGVVSPMGETYEVQNLYVADASVLPTATGVNPMISIMATAHYLAQGMKTQL